MLYICIFVNVYVNLNDNIYAKFLYIHVFSLEVMLYVCMYIYFLSLEHV
jgi:hypothetical protein